MSHSAHDYVSGADVNDVKDSWAIFKAESDELIMLPLRGRVGTSKLKVKATDTKGASSEVALTIKVTERADDKVTQVC